MDRTLKIELILLTLSLRWPIVSRHMKSKSPALTRWLLLLLLYRSQLLRRLNDAMEDPNFPIPVVSPSSRSLISITPKLKLDSSCMLVSFNSSNRSVKTRQEDISLMLSRLHVDAVVAAVAVVVVVVRGAGVEFGSVVSATGTMAVAVAMEVAVEAEEVAVLVGCFNSRCQAAIHGWASVGITNSCDAASSAALTADQFLRRSPHEPKPGTMSPSSS